MERSFRYAITACGCCFLVVALGFFFRWSWATALWPWADSRLSFIFVASILAAVAVPTIWIGLTGELGAIAPGALNLCVMYAGLAVYLSLLAVDQHKTALVVAAVFCGIGFLSTLAEFLWSRRIPIRDPRPMPPLVRGSFGFFTVALVLTGSALLLKATHIFPWPLKPQSSVVYGWMFLGAAVYFMHGALRPSWHNAAGQCLGFLAYDLVLIGPFLQHFSSVASARLPSLIIYTAIIIYSGGLSIYYLFIYEPTRFRLGAPPSIGLGPAGGSGATPDLSAD